MNRASLGAAIHVASVFATYLALAMLIPGLVDLLYNNSDWKAFIISGTIIAGAAIAIMLATRGSPPPISTRFAFLIVNVLWLTLAIVGTMPFLLSSVDLSLTDAFFESVSGITTTGGTVIVGLDRAPPGLLLWRSLLCFFGGLGVIALGLFLLPFLNLGGISYFKIESSDIEERPFERLRPYALSIIGVYVALNILCAASYWSAGMDGFDAINHAMSTVATGGFSTHDTSFSRYADNPMILFVGSLFMFLGGLPFSMLVIFLLRRRIDAIKDPQIKVYAFYIFMFVISVTIYISFMQDITLLTAFSHAMFNITSVITTTGFSSDDYLLWGSFAVTCFYAAMFLGGCSGSTSGSIKAYRFLVLFQLIRNLVRRLVYPDVVQPVRYGERVVDQDFQRAVLLFISSFFLVWLIATLLLGMTGLDLPTATTASLASLTNVGPGLSPQIGPAGSFAGLPDLAKWVCAFAMLLGRLEILAVFVILSPTFWRS